MSDYDPDHFRFAERRNGTIPNDSPIEDDWRQGAPRTCVGYGIECDNELEADEELCSRCQAGSDLDDRDGENDSELIYPHLLDS